MNIGPRNILRTLAQKSWQRTLFLISIASGVSYLLAPLLRAQLGDVNWLVVTIIKGLAIASLVPLAWHWVKGTDGVLLGAALAFSSIGDIVLSLRNGDYLAFGLLSFLVAHLFF